MRFATVLLVLVSAVGLGHRATAASPADSCVKFWGETRYGALAYNHLVHIANSCSATAKCTVSTDVTPAPQEAEVAGKSEIVVTTFIGSPARAFIPRVKCTMNGT